MGLKVKLRDRRGKRSVATGSRGGTYGYSSGPILVGKRKKKVKPSPGSRYTDPTKKKKVKSGSPFTDPATKRKVVDLGSSM